MHTALTVVLIALALAGGFLAGQASTRSVVPVAQAQVVPVATPINWEIECNRAVTREAAYACLQRHNLIPPSEIVLPVPVIPVSPLSVR